MIPELQVTTHYSFLRGASSPEELFATAAILGIPALGIVDRNSLAGIVRCWEAAKATGVRMIVGARLDLRDGTSLLVYPTDRAAYSRLTRLLSLGKGRAGKGACDLGREDVAAWAEGLVAILLTDMADERLADGLAWVAATFGDRGYAALTRRFRPDDHVHLDAIAGAARAAGVATVATGTCSTTRRTGASCRTS
jgi:error-prone DNA polymerase